MTEVMAICEWCGDAEKTTVTEQEWERYLKGELVQKVWPARSVDDREILVGARTGVHTCKKCWEHLDEDDDDHVEGMGWDG